MPRHNHEATCQVCGRTFPTSELFPAATVRPSIARLITKSIPKWISDGYVCTADLNRFQHQYIELLLRREAGEMSKLDAEVADSMHKQEVLAENIELQFEREYSLGERMADRVATFGGSWVFLGAFALMLVVWIVANSMALVATFDPFPFILLNLILSCLAAVQAPVIMMSQNRREAKDRMRSQYDYKVNLKAELEIRHLHEKVDHLLRHQWERLVEIQRIQIDFIDELRNRKA